MPFIRQNMITRLFVRCWYARSRATASGDISTSAQEIIESYTTGMYLCIISNYITLSVIVANIRLIDLILKYLQKLQLPS